MAMKWAAVVLGICVSLAEGEGAGEALEELCAGHKVKAVIGKAPSGKTMVLVDGRPTPLFWADLSGGGPDYIRAGLNTVFVELSWPGKDKKLEEVFPEWDKALLAVKRQGLYAVIYIHNSMHANAGKAPWTFDESWRDAIQAIVKRYRGATNLVGWNFSDEPGDALSYPDAAFRAFLSREYGNIESLNRAWGSTYGRFEDIRLEYKADGHSVPEESMVTPESPFGIGPKAFDSARFKIARVAEAHERFERAVREVDPETPLWSGAHNLGWPATQVPAGWGIFFDFYPGSSGNDYDTHHIWMMDVGRGPNVRPAMQMLLPERWDEPRWHLDARVLRGWMVESAVHGAAGITFWPWSFLGVDNRAGDRSSSTERIDMCGMTIRTLEASGIFEMLPVNTIAVMYQPYAEGWGAYSQVYGVLRQPTEEPFVLMEQLKYGTRFGQVDYLTNVHLRQAKLDEYGVILAQFAADISDEDLARLGDYVRGGGVLLADVGFDCLHGGKTVTGMSDGAKELFGIRSLRVSQAGAGRFVATGEFGELLGGLKKDVEVTDRLFQLALDVEVTTAVAALRGPGGQGLYVNRVGKGYAIFCSALGWSRWTVADPLFRKIHNALFARRAGIELCGNVEGADGSKEPYLSLGCEVARFATGYALQNRTDGQVSLTVRVGGQEHRHTLAPRSVLLVKDGRMIPLGSGIWPAERGSQ